jgi:hypothetical protein
VATPLQERASSPKPPTPPDGGDGDGKDGDDRDGDGEIAAMDEDTGNQATTSRLYHKNLEFYHKNQEPIQQKFGNLFWFERFPDCSSSSTYVHIS